MLNNIEKEILKDFEEMDAENITIWKHERELYKSF